MRGHREHMGFRFWFFNFFVVTKEGLVLSRDNVYGRPQGGDNLPAPIHIFTVHLSVSVVILSSLVILVDRW